MTTLSKEDVVRMTIAANVIEHQFYKGNLDKLTHFATLARADLVAENERLKDAQFKRLECESEKRMKLRTALAAAEADNERLRKALNEILTTDWVSDKVRRIAKSALAQPRDDSALREMIAGVYGECAKELIRLDYFCAANVILALVEKKLASLTS